ncbi:SmdA family multidrug ABC transporter permease/ATP-binding protein [Candidatus Erwinia haradaeae]|uniref:Multidrug resistance-like ATP-binding protein MdlA n=1 Tax=Candidatus Erwinia haradaeae TaxID=1922217 RepID=A0A451D382_9GAMM|nr:SmdA family multidrug ABC transporter permease/ATP-binding protein [Candidatus Erwinia haradaeae]VFP80120.1 Multidrug resistance-like ATP-binding protein MdlA [Candidatus Erwinia haradaeae]
MQLFSQLSWYFLREWRRYLGAVFLLFAIAILKLFPPYIVGKIVDGVSQGVIRNSQLMTWIFVMFVTAIIIYFLHYIWRILLFGASYYLAVELRARLYHKLSHQNPEFYLRHRTGDLIARATNDVDRVVFAAGEGFLTLVDSCVMGITVLVVMSHQISFNLTVLALLPMPIMAVVIKCYGHQLHHRFQNAQAAFSSLNDQTQESLSSIRMIKAFGLESYQSDKFSEIAKETGVENLRVARIDARFDPTIYIFVALSSLLAIVGGSWMVWHGSMTLGQLTSFVMYLGLMIWPMLAFAWMFNIVERGNAAWSRIYTLLSEDPVVPDGHQGLPEERGVLKISVKNFYYPGSQKSALSGLDVIIKPGQMLGLCGPTGSGKSTVLSLVQRHFDINQGEILFHNIPLSQLRLDIWRSRLAVASQTPFLFSDSIAQNIALGCPNATQCEIEDVARLAHIHEDILRLPYGYQTEVGERGIMLSGGQKQRISIARALLLNSEILVLDDALSAVDGRTEHQIMHNLRHWGEKRTVIITAHRLSVLSEASEILVLQHGSVIQRGDHKKLLSSKGWYREMYRYQQLEEAFNENDTTCGVYDG